jgi:hypothetical protein
MSSILNISSSVMGDGFMYIDGTGLRMCQSRSVSVDLVYLTDENSHQILDSDGNPILIGNDANIITSNGLYVTNNLEAVTHTV